MFLKAKNTGFVALSVFLRDSFIRAYMGVPRPRHLSKNLCPSTTWQ